MPNEGLNNLNEEQINELIEKIKKNIEDIPHWNVYAEFFACQKMGAREIRDFLFDDFKPEPDSKFGKPDLELSKIEDILKDELRQLGLNLTDLKRYLNSNTTPIGVETNLSQEGNPQFDESGQKRLLIALVEYCLYAALDKDAKLNIEDDCEDQIAYAKEQIRNSGKKGKRLYYRGHSDASWWMVPSLARSFAMRNESGDFYDFVMITRETLYLLYNEGGYPDSLIKKYNDYYGPKPIRSCKGIDYRFLAFMQHAISYSPLLDFSGDPRVSYSFALTASNPNEFMDMDSAIYIYDVPEDVKIIKKPQEVKKIISDMFILSVNEEIIPGTDGEAYDPLNCKSVKISYKTYKMIAMLLIPRFAVIDIPTNDRMLRQRGIFVLLFNYLIVNGKTFDKLDKMAGVTKHIIKAHQKKDLLEWLRDNYPNYDYAYLMNPYLDFED